MNFVQSCPRSASGPSAAFLSPGCYLQAEVSCPDRCGSVDPETSIVVFVSRLILVWRYLGSCWMAPVVCGQRMNWIILWLSSLIVSWFWFLSSSFFMISPTDQQVHCWAWLKNRLPNDSNLTMEDVTWKYTGRKSLKADLVLQPEVTNGVNQLFKLSRVAAGSLFQTVAWKPQFRLPSSKPGAGRQLSFHMDCQETAWWHNLFFQWTLRLSTAPYFPKRNRNHFIHICKLDSR